MEVISAADLLPEVFAVEEDRDAYDDLQYDLYNLTAADLHAIQASTEVCVVLCIIPCHTYAIMYRIVRRNY